MKVNPFGTVAFVQKTSLPSSFVVPFQIMWRYLWELFLYVVNQKRLEHLYMNLKQSKNSQGCHHMILNGTTNDEAKEDYSVCLVCRESSQRVITKYWFHATLCFNSVAIHGEYGLTETCKLKVRGIVFLLSCLYYCRCLFLLALQFHFSPVFDLDREI